MKIAFYAPFKPLDHPNPSGDRAIGRGLAKFLLHQGFTLTIPSRLRTRWIYLRWWKWPPFFLDLVKCLIRLKKNPPDVWFTYHTYYKAPDILGPLVCRLLNIKYVIFQGIYSTKRRRKLKTAVGFYLNRVALNRADYVFTNKSTDFKNLKRIIPTSRLSYIKPGLYPDKFNRKEKTGRQLRQTWKTDKHPVILSAAMFRDDVKTTSLLWLIDCCAGLLDQGCDFVLVIAGSGVMETEIKDRAQSRLGSSVRFAGKLDPEKMAGFYSAGDLFVYPGINEGLGMVFLEAQSCGLPVVAFDNAGIPEAVIDGETGFLTPMYDDKAFQQKMALLLGRKNVRQKMGRRAADYVKSYHNLELNYYTLVKTLQQVVRK